MRSETVLSSVRAWSGVVASTPWGASQRSTIRSGLTVSSSPTSIHKIVAVGRSILIIVWHLLSDEQGTFHDLGSDHYTRHVHPDTKKRNHIRQLEALGYTVTLTPAA